MNMAQVVFEVPSWISNDQAARHLTRAGWVQDHAVAR